MVDRLGYLQLEVIRIAVEDKSISGVRAKTIFGTRSLAMYNLRKLRIKGYLKPSGMAEYSPTEKAIELYSNIKSNE